MAKRTMKEYDPIIKQRNALHLLRRIIGEKEHILALEQEEDAELDRHTRTSQDLRAKQAQCMANIFGYLDAWAEQMLKTVRKEDRKKNG